MEDNAADVYLMRTALKVARIAAEVHVVTDGEQAIDFIDAAEADESAPCPDLVILDINLPKKQGGEVLQHLRSRRRCGETPVIAVSTSDSASDRAEMARLGSSGYFHKPSDYESFLQLGTLIRQVLRGDSVK